MLLEGLGDSVVVAVEPLVTQLHCLQWVHSHEVRKVSLNQVFHLVDSDSVGDTFLLKEAEFGLVSALFWLLLVGSIVNGLTSFQTVLDLVKPSEDVCLNRLYLEEHLETLLEISLQLLE